MEAILLYIVLLLYFLLLSLPVILQFVAILLSVAFVAYACHQLFTIPRQRRPVAPQHKIWAIAAVLVLPYLLFPVFVSDFAVAGAKLRHDVIALNAWNKTWLWGILLLVNLPLLLFQTPHKRDWTYLALTRRIHLMIWATFLLASAFTFLARSPIIGAKLGELFKWAYFWWDWALIWLEADGMRTQQELAIPKFRYGKMWWRDALWLMLAMLPLLLFYRAKLTEEQR
ncbi:hypothetical protein [Wielerella bovis]|uniref:hypothetical protein n=1 Tax=Wielerella bovis TaxID=2917790 RepID=UPI0020198F19|nr:hypothetical protein [Wielerella bovis]MCG7657623.1 hypothetical protein [Wielerella bovis]MCG7659844.1 hypothetical protein [Wielerella bovis]